MTRQNYRETDPDSARVEPTSTPATAVTSPQVFLSSEQFELWANLVARGETPFPQGLVPEEQERLWHEVCRRRRIRLVQFIARTIAQDIVHECGPL